MRARAIRAGRLPSQPVSRKLGQIWFAGDRACGSSSSRRMAAIGMVSRLDRKNRDDSSAALFRHEAEIDATALIVDVIEIIESRRGSGSPCPYIEISRRFVAARTSLVAALAFSDVWNTRVDSGGQAINLTIVGCRSSARQTRCVLFQNIIIELFPSRGSGLRVSFEIKNESQHGTARGTG